MPEQNWEVKGKEVQFEKRSIKDIQKDAETLDPVKVGDEVLLWLSSNVENFIDSQNKIFKLDLVLDNVAGMSETTKLQNLYRSIPDNDEMTEKELDKASKCRIILDKITKKAHNHIKSSKDKLENLFKQMIFYYEKIIINPANRRAALEIDTALKTLIKHKDEVATDEEKKQIQEQIVAKIKEGEKLVKFDELVGTVDISGFEYEAFSVGVRILANKNEAIDENTVEQEKEVVNSYIIPEGFTVWVEINSKPKQRPISIF